MRGALRGIVRRRLIGEVRAQCIVPPGLTYLHLWPSATSWPSDPDGTAGRFMNFKLGITRLSNFQNMIAALVESRFDDAATEALDSRWARQVGQRAQTVIALGIPKNNGY